MLALSVLCKFVSLSLTFPLFMNVRCMPYVFSLPVGSFQISIYLTYFTKTELIVVCSLSQGYSS